MRSYERLTIFAATLLAAGGLRLLGNARGELEAAAQRPQPRRDAGATPDGPRVAAATDGPSDNEGFEPLPPPRPGDWRSAFDEPAQSFEAFVAAGPLQPTPTRRTIVLQPLGAAASRQRALLEAVRAYAEAFFQLPARVAPALRLPAVPRRSGAEGPQHDAHAIAEALATARPDDAIAYIGITFDDLYAPGLHFVFGLGLFEVGAGVYSLSRFGAPPRANEAPSPRLLRRTLKVMSHEIGHVFGLHHCAHFRCEMNGVNTLEEADRAPAHACPVCQRKLAHALGFDRRTRRAALAAFYERHGLAEEARFLRR